MKPDLQILQLAEEWIVKEEGQPEFDKITKFEWCALPYSMHDGICYESGHKDRNWRRQRTTKGRFVPEDFIQDLFKLDIVRQMWKVYKEREDLFDV